MPACRTPWFHVHVRRPFVSSCSTFARVFQIKPIDASPVRMSCSDSEPEFQYTASFLIFRSTFRARLVSSG